MRDNKWARLLAYENAISNLIWVPLLPFEYCALPAGYPFHQVETAFEFLRKPFSMPTFLDVVKKVIWKNDNHSTKSDNDV